MIDGSICQRCSSCAVNGANQVIGDVVGSYICKPVEGIVKVMCIGKCDDNGAVNCMFVHKLFG